MSSFSLLNNPYAVLAHEPLKKKMQEGATAKIMYNVVTGKDRIDCELSPASAGGLHSATTSTAFYGNCHNCKYRAHSQRQCPLRRCTICGVFGHAASICQN
jgi:hypothetical protein